LKRLIPLALRKRLRGISLSYFKIQFSSTHFLSGSHRKEEKPFLVPDAFTETSKIDESHQNSNPDFRLKYPLIGMEENCWDEGSSYIDYFELNLMAFGSRKDICRLLEKRLV